MKNQTATRSKSRKITALYSRLSEADNLVGQSGSITNQRDILEKYAIEQGFTNIVHFSET